MSRRQFGTGDGARRELPHVAAERYIAAAEDLGSSPAAVLLVLALRADNETRECWPSVSHLEKLTKLSRRTVQRALRDLEERGAVAIVEAGRGKRPSRYALHLPGREGASQRHPRGVTVTPEGRHGDALTSQRTTHLTGQGRASEKDMGGIDRREVGETLVVLAELARLNETHAPQREHVEAGIARHRDRDPMATARRMLARRQAGRGKKLRDLGPAFITEMGYETSPRRQPRAETTQEWARRQAAKVAALDY